MDPFEQLWGPPKASGAGPLTIQLLKQLEGFAPQAKWDVRQYSGGYGSRAAPGERFTPESAEARLNQDVAPVNSWLDKNVTQPLTPERRAAFNSFGYNLGVDDLERLKPDINRGDWSTVGNRMLTFNKAGGEVNQGLINRRQKEAAMVTGGAMPETTAMPMPRQPGPLTSAMGGMSNSFVPGIMGGGDEPGYFGKLLADPTFLMGASVLGGGLAGRDAGTALQQGAQAASATSEMTEKRRRAQAWQKIMGGDMSAPILKGVPEEVMPLIQSMGPEQGMQFLGQLAMKKLGGKQIGVAAPGSSFYDPDTGKVLGQAPTESPYGKELAQEQAKADVKSGEHAKAGQQMLDLTDKIAQLAGQPGTPARQTFEDATGPVQGSDWYQTAKGFVNSKAETPVVHAQLQQDLGTLKLLATRAYLSGQGQVTEAERAAVAEAIGRVEKAPSAEAGLQALNNVRGIIQQVFMKPPVAQPGAPAAAPGAPPPQMAPDMAMPGVAVQGGMPGANQEQPQMAPPPGPQGGPPQPGGNAPITATGPGGQKLQLDPTSGQWAPVQAPAGPPQPGGGGAPAPAAAPAFSRDASPLWARGDDKAKLRANPTPEMMQQYDAVFGKGEAAKVVMQPRNGPIGIGRGSYRATP